MSGSSHLMVSPPYCPLYKIAIVIIVEFLIILIINILWVRQILHEFRVGYRYGVSQYGYGMRKSNLLVTHVQP